MRARPLDNHRTPSTSPSSNTPFPNYNVHTICCSRAADAFRTHTVLTTGDEGIVTLQVDMTSAFNTFSHEVMMKQVLARCPSLARYAW